MENYPEKLISEVDQYLRIYKDAKIFYYETYDQNLYLDKSIVTTIYKIYIVYLNVCIIYSYDVCSKEEWNFDIVKKDTINAWNIKMCYEKSGLFNKQ